MDGPAGSPTRTPSPDGHAAPPGDYRCWDDYMRDVEIIEADRYDRVAERRFAKAARLAPTVLVFNALLEGQQVPVSALDPAWRARYGL